MTDDKKNNNFRAGFMADMLKDLQEELGIEHRPKRNGKRRKVSEKPAEPKGKAGCSPAEQAGHTPQGTASPARSTRQGTGQGTAMPAGHAAEGTALPAGHAAEAAPMPAIHVPHVTNTADPRPGDLLLGTYRVESRPFKGGMGAVWRVHHTGWDVDLAMKRPHPEAFRTEAQKQSFTDECRYWMNLGLHPNIVSCYYVREIEGVPTIFSEWMDNGSLESHIKNRTLYEGSEKDVQERLLDIAIQFARGLHYAHENDLIHQDVKPDNLLLTRDWSAKVSDFGLAKARTMLTFLDGTATELENDPDATMVTPGGGRTPAYCSPEQAAAQLLTRRTDIYSWAVSVLEMYLGDKPWAHGRELTGPLVGVVCRDYFDMCVERPVPKALQDLLAKCLEMKPDDRPRDFGEVEAELLEIYRQETGARYPRQQPKAASDTADSLNNKAISHLDLGEEKEAVSLLERCVRMRHFEGALNLALYRWRTGKTDVSTMFQAVDDLETLFWERREELDRIREEICLEGCGLPRPPEFKMVSAQVPQDAVLTTAAMVDGKLIAVVRKRWRDGNMYYYVCHFDIDTGALLMQYPGDDEQPGIPYVRGNRNFNLFDGGRQLSIHSYPSDKEDNGYYDVVRQKRIREYDGCRLDNGAYVLKDLYADEFFTSKGEVLPEFQDNVPLLGIKADAERVYEIRRASTWEPCARIAAKKVTWL
ncbi:MAG: serine/threonine-protein kinase, partial [Eubacteriales bacterium]|nr:serine/threonine-protein kinase [Eubacteriales bacterium]